MLTKYIFLLLLNLGPTFGADAQAIRDKATALVQSADQAAASSQNTEAENGYRAAIAQCDLLPPEWYHCKTDVLWSLARFYEVKDASKAEAVNKERLDILVARQKDAEHFPDLDIGIALFDLQTVIEAGNLTNTDREVDGLSYMERHACFTHIVRRSRRYETPVIAALQMSKVCTVPYFF